MLIPHQRFSKCMRSAGPINRLSQTHRAQRRLHDTAGGAEQHAGARAHAHWIVPLALGQLGQVDAALLRVDVTLVHVCGCVCVCVCVWVRVCAYSSARERGVLLLLLAFDSHFRAGWAF